MLYVQEGRKLPRDAVCTGRRGLARDALCSTALLEIIIGSPMKGSTNNMDEIPMERIPHIKIVLFMMAKPPLYPQIPK